MEDSGRGGSGRSNDKKKGKKAVNTQHIRGKKERSGKVQGLGVDGKLPGVSMPLGASEEGGVNMNTTPNQKVVTKKRKRMKKKKMGGDKNTIVKAQVTGTGSEILSVNTQRHDHEIQKAGKAVATTTTATAQMVASKRSKRKKKKQGDNVKLTALTSTESIDNRQMTTTGLLKKTPLVDDKMSYVAQPIKNNAVVVAHVPSPAIATKQTMDVTTSPKPISAQVKKVASKLQTQHHAQKSEAVTMTVNVSGTGLHTMAKKVKARTVGVSAKSVGSRLVVAKKMEFETEHEQTIGVSNVSNQMDSSLKEPLMLQHVPKADTAITAKLKDEVSTASCSITTETPTTTNADCDLPTAAFDSKSMSSRPENDASAMVPAISSKSTHTTAVVATPSTVCKNRVSDKSMLSETSSTSTNMTKASPLTSIACSPQQLASTHLASSPLAKPQLAASKVTGVHKRRRSIDQSSLNPVTDPSQPPTKRSAATNKAAVVQSRATERSNEHSCADEKRVDQLPNSARHFADPQPADTFVNVQEAHETARMAAVGQATPTVKAVPALSEFVAGRYDKIKLVNTRRCAAQSTQLLASMMSLGSAPEHITSSLQTQVSMSRGCQPSPKQLDSAVKAEVATSVIASSKVGAAGSRSMALPCGSKTQEADIGVDSHTCEQTMTSGELEASSQKRSSLTQPAQPMAPPRLQDAWGPSFGMVLPAQGVSYVYRTLSTTPLSSWFLSKGCANFVKQVRFSDHTNGDDNSNSSRDDISLPQQSYSSSGADKTSLKTRGSVMTMNAFLKSLTTQSYWRTWYGTVDLDNLLDPPLANVPDKLRTYNMMPFTLSERMTECNSNTLEKKTTDLEQLEAEIRQEKQRGSVFSDQLLMMLQGKTVSGKLFEEECRSLLHQ